MSLGIRFSLGPLHYYQRLTPRKRRSSGGGFLGGIVRLTFLVYVWIFKLCIVIYGLALAFCVYFYLGLAWLLAPLAAVIVAKQRGYGLTETIDRYRAKVTGWIRSFHQGVTRALRRMA
jgi:hypothetical protein